MKKITKKVEEKKIEYINFCPVCNSTEVKKEAIGEGIIFNCKHCNYSFNTFPEIDSSKVQYLGPVKNDNITYPKVEKTRLNNDTANVAIAIGIVIMIFAIYLLTKIAEKEAIITSTSILILGIIIIINAINNKKAAKKSKTSS
jgi:hypothetical protein